MYLLELDDDTGLVRESDTSDGWKAISVFRELVKKYGIEALTVVALTVDYSSPFLYYIEKDRGRRAMEEIFSDRDKFDLSEDIFRRAIEKYGELQYNINLEQNEINQAIRKRYLDLIRLANEENNDDEIARLNRALAAHNKNIENFEKTFNWNAEMKKSITRNKYELTRIEAELLKKNNKFSKHGTDKNPNKLGLKPKN